jgi:hypothetical protein
MYKYKNLRYGFVIICADCKIDCLKNTINSITTLYPTAKTVAVLADNCKQEDFDDIAKLEPTYRGGIQLSSMINAGMRHSCDEWNFIIISKGWLRGRIDTKYSYFIESEKDILFPILNRKLNFIDADLNGMFIHKKSFVDIGEFINTKSLEVSKTIWSFSAVEKGYRFKGIVGAYI